jgi:hypothetical protein
MTIRSQAHAARSRRLNPNQVRYREPGTGSGDRYRPGHQNGDRACGWGAQQHSPQGLDDVACRLAATTVASASAFLRSRTAAPPHSAPRRRDVGAAARFLGRGIRSCREASGRAASGFPCQFLPRLGMRRPRHPRCSACTCSSRAAGIHPVTVRLRLVHLRPPRRPPTIRLLNTAGCALTVSPGSTRKRASRLISGAM